MSSGRFFYFGEYATIERRMPRKDAIHEAVCTALVKDGWLITNDPFRIEYEDVDIYADLRVERVEKSSTIRRALVIEIKGFTGPSPVHLLASALGQYELYRTYLVANGMQEGLYLAISKETYDSLFSRLSFQIVVEQRRLGLLIIDIEAEEVVRWIN
ncbi:MAG: element excision factor XisH family protein [Capsulimonadales bacterium]|nr:element excision factor XisH family protein [Capsulimonadales bacterium]